MAKKTDDMTPEIVEIHGVSINLTAVKRGKKGGKPMTKSDFYNSFRVKRIPTGKKDKDGNQIFTTKQHPQLDEIWDEVQKLVKK